MKIASIITFIRFYNQQTSTEYISHYLAALASSPIFLCHRCFSAVDAFFSNRFVVRFSATQKELVGVYVPPPPPPPSQHMCVVSYCVPCAPSVPTPHHWHSIQCTTSRAERFECAAAKKLFIILNLVDFFEGANIVWVCVEWTFFCGVIHITRRTTCSRSTQT